MTLWLPLLSQGRDEGIARGLPDDGVLSLSVASHSTKVNAAFGRSMSISSPGRGQVLSGHRASSPISP
jgi:hypothetical protein